MSFQLILKGSLGDHICYTGLPEALYLNLKDHPKIEVVTKYPELFKDNKYVQFILDKIKHPIDLLSNRFIIPYETENWHWLVYRPIRAYYQLTGKIIDRNLIQPNLYFKNKITKPGYIVISDQAGWPTRRGYGKYFDELSQKLIELGYHITVIHNPLYTDCNGNIVPREIEHYHLSTRDDYTSLISILAEAQYFIGYDSGMAHLAAALQVPSILFAGSVPPIVFRHNVCIKVFESCSDYCHSENCSKACGLHFFPNVNDEIIDIVEKGKYG